MRKIQEHISCYMMRSEIQGEILSQMLQQMSLFLANTNGKILLLIVAKMHRSLTAGNISKAIMNLKRSLSKQ